MGSGRIDLRGPTALPFQLFEDAPARTFGARSVSYQQSRNPLSDYFFGAENTEALQQGIRYGVYEATGGELTVGRQSDTELHIVMRGVFLEHAAHAPGNLEAQVRALNAKVLQYAVPNVAGAARMYQRYVKDVSEAPVPLRQPLHTSRAGTRSLELFRRT